MQSGISASQELHDAFNALVSDDSQRALLATISNEQLLPGATIPASSTTFQSDLHALQPHLSPTAASYILLKTSPTPSGYTAITYVPNAAPVRQKMLFASTRLTLVRELGIERFSQTIFTTEMAELTEEGWKKHEAHEGLEAPLTEEESGLKGVREAEAYEAQGTSGRRGHVAGKMDVKTGEGVLEALKKLKEGGRGCLVQLRYTLPGEILTLDSEKTGVEPKEVGKVISQVEPRYSFYKGEGDGVVFVYTCPTASKVKERMIYSTGKSWTRIVAERDAELVIAKSLEATDPSDLDVEALGGGSGDAGAGAEEVKPASSGFARPKRPGRR